MVTTSLVGSAASPTKVLVVDSSTVQRLILKRQLERLGHTVATAVDGFAAVEAVLHGGFDAVLLDLQMPGLDSHAIARRLRACGTTADIRILGITALRGPEERERDLAAGIDDVLIKPIGLAELRYRLTRLFDLEEPAEACRLGVVENWETITALDVAGRRTGRPLVRQVIQRFFDDGIHKLHDMSSALASRDATALARSAHFMAGGLAMLRVRGLADRFRELESSAEAGDLSGCVERLEDVERLYRSLKEDLHRL